MSNVTCKLCNVNMNTCMHLGTCANAPIRGLLTNMAVLHKAIQDNDCHTFWRDKKQ